MEFSSSTLMSVEDASMIGVTCSRDYEYLIVTAQSSLMRYKISNGESRTWNIGKKEPKFSIPAVYNNKERLISYKQTKKQLVQWSHEDETPANATVKDLNEKDGSVFSLNESKALGDYLIAVSHNGCVWLCKGDTLELLKLVEPSVGDQTTWTYTHEVDTITYLFCMHYNTAQAGYKLQIYCLPKIGEVASISQTNSVQLTSPEADLQIQTCSYDPQSRALAILWSNGIFQVYQFATVDSVLFGKPQQTVSMKLSLFALPSKKPNGKAPAKRKLEHRLEEGVKSAFVQTNLLALVGRDVDANNIVTLWNTAYGALQTKSTLDNTDDILQVLSAKNKLVCVGPSNITIHDVHGLTKSNLLSVLGTMRYTLSAIYEGSIYGPIQQHAFIGDLSQLVKPPSEQEQEWQKKADDILEKMFADNVKKEEDFLKIFKELTTFAKSKSEKVQIHPAAVSRIVKKCTQNKYWKVLSLLIKAELLNVSSFPSLIDNLIQDRQVLCVLYCLQYVRDITDNILVQILRFIVHISKDELIQSVNILLNEKNFKTTVSDPVEARNYLLDLIVAVKRENIFIYTHLRNLELSEVVIMLEYLVKWIDLYSTNMNVKSDIQQHRLVQTSYTGILSWLSMIMDTHFAQIVLSAETHPLMHRLHEIVSREVLFSQEMVKLREELKHFEGEGNKSNDTKTRKRANLYMSSERDFGKYQLESICL